MRYGLCGTSNRTPIVQGMGAMTQFGILHPDGSMSNVRFIRQSDLRKCRHVIPVAEHYRDDGTCYCNDKTHVEMREWGYKWSKGQWR